MKLRTGWWMVVIASGALWAQSAQPSAPATTSKAPAQTTAAKPAATTSAPAAKKTTKTTKSTKKKSSSTTAAAPSGNVAKNVATASKSKRAAAPSKRDPFISPVQSRNNIINCTGGGKRCLVLDQTRLEGIVKAPNGMIAVVANSANKAYFLRENDPVYNGFVVRITPDSVIFRETSTDRLGKKTTHEVVKKVNAPVV